MPRAPEVWEDEWYNDDHISVGARHIRAPGRRARDDGYGHRTAEFLVPENRTTTSLHRTRSQGHAPAPNVTIYNTTRLDNDSSPNVRTEQKSPLVNPYAEPRGRARRMPGEWGIEDEIAELRLDIAKQNRSRSRSKHHRHDGSPGHEFERWRLEQVKLEQEKQRLKELEDRLETEKHDAMREELIKRKLEAKYMRDRQEREAEEERIKRAEESLQRDWELRHQREELERSRREEEAKSREERLKRDWEYEYEREERKKFEREESAKQREARLKRDWEMAYEREQRKKEDEARAEEEERKRLVAENLAKAEKRAKEKEEERQRIIADNAIKMDKAEKERIAARQRAVDEFNKEQAEQQRRAREERERIVAEYEAKKVADAAEAKRKREELIMQLRIEEEQRKQKEKEEWERFLLKQKQKEEEEKAEKEKQEKQLEEAMRKRLAQFGFQDNQIQAMIKPDEAAKLQQGMSPANPLRLAHQPTYVKVSREHLAMETLQYYDIPYEIDRSDPDYIIIKREMEPRETEILFEHTRRLRSRGTTRLLIEERSNDHGKNEYAWVRRRKPSRSPSRRRSSPRRVVGIKEMFF